MPAAHPRRGPHPVHGLGGRTAGVPERCLVRRGEVRGPRLRVRALREDLLGRPIRITTVDAGLVETEFSLVRYRGTRTPRAVYESVDPVTPDEVADCVMFALTRPLHVNVDEIVVKALAQSSGARSYAEREVAAVLTILEGSTFCMSDDRGDIAEPTSGFFAHDTRFLSRLRALRRRVASPLLSSVASSTSPPASSFVTRA